MNPGPIASILVLPLAVVSCERPIDVRDPSTYIATERVVAAEELDCPAASITFESFAGPTQTAHGCGREAMVTCVDPGAFGGAGGECFSVQDLKKRAAFELPCDGAIQLTALDAEGRTVGVLGCGKRAVYQYVQGRDRYDWRLSTAAAPAGPPPPAPP